MTRKRFLSILQYLFFLGLGLFLVWYQFYGMTAAEVSEFKASLRDANYWLVIPIIVLALASHLSRAARWKLLIAPMGYSPSVTNAFGATMVGYLANSAVPRLGEVLKCSILGRYEKIPADKLFGTIIIERMFDLACYAIFIGITILVQIDVAGPYAQQSIEAIIARSPLPWWALLLVCIAAIALLVIIARVLLKRYAHLRPVQKVSNILRGIREGFSTILRLKQKGLFLAHTIFIWLMYLLQVYIGFQAMEATNMLGLGPACSVLTLATLAMILTPGGIGAFPVAVQKVLLLYNVNNRSFGWLMWTVSTAITVVTGFIFTLALPYINRNRKQHETVRNNPQ